MRFSLYERLRNKKIYSRMYHSSLIMAIIPLVILTIIFLLVFLSVYINQYSSQEEIILQSYSESCSNELYHFDSAVAAMTQDAEVQNFFINQFVLTDYERYRSVHTLTESAVDQFHMLSYVTDIALMTNNYQITQIYNGPHRDFYPELLDVRTLAQLAFYQKNNTYLCDARQYSTGTPEQNTDGILYIKRITDSENNSVNLGYLLAYIDKNAFFDFAQLVSEDRPNEQHFVLDPMNSKQVIVHSAGLDNSVTSLYENVDFVSDTGQLLFLYRPFEMPPFFAYRYNIDALDWIIVSLQPINLMLQTVVTILLLSLLLILIIFLLQSFVARQVAGSIDIPLRQILDSLHQIEQGNFDSSRDDKFKDELAIIQNSVNSTALLLKKMFMREREHEKQQYKLRFQALMAQTNPHFLMNTLNSVRLLASIQGADNISALCTALVNLFQDMLKSDKVNILLKEELALVRDYTLIMRYRYLNRFHMSYDIQVSERQTVVPRFIIQPLIENALQHGLNETMPMLNIMIRIRQDEGCLLIDVMDNGIGIPSARLEEIRSTIDTLTESKKNGVHIGLYNIHQRLKILYGDLYGLSIASEEGKFTCVSVKIPLQITNDYPTGVTSID